MAAIVKVSDSSLQMNSRCMPSREANPATTADAERTDRSLLRRIRGGEEDAATTFYLRYAERLQAVAKSQTSANLASRFDPEDVVQSVFRTFFRRATEGEYDVPEGEELWKLLLIISLNKIRALAAFHKAAKRDVATTVAISPGDRLHGDAGADQEQALCVLEMIIDEALADLPEVQREIIRLRIEGHGVEEISASTKRSKRSVERALQQFRSRLGRLLFEEPEGDVAH